MESCVDNSHFQDCDKYGGEGRRNWSAFHSYFSYSLSCSISIPSFTQWKGVLTTAVSSSAWCALQKAQTPLPGSLGTRRRRVNVGVLQEKACSEWGAWRAAFTRGLLRGCCPLLECSREAPEGPRAASGSPGRGYLEAHPFKWPLKPGASQLSKEEFFPGSEACWAPLILGSGAWVVGFTPALPCVLWESPRKQQNWWCGGSRLYLCLQVRGTSVHRHLPPWKGRLLYNGTQQTASVLS